MLKKHLAGLLAAACIAAPAFAQDEHEHGDAAIAQSFIKEIQTTEAAYASEHGTKFFQNLALGQKPRATVVTCSDSRVQTNMLDKKPEGDLFMIRNIGNQIATAPGSVQYGVNHLNSSLLLIIGGAITAANGDYSTLEDPIRKELDTIRITKGSENVEGVKTNVNNQVAQALTLFGDKVKAGHLIIVGGVYDFADDMKQGAGKLNIVNINGETDPAKLNSMPLVTAAEHAHGHQH
jgi:carbonic anhydrase